MIFNEEKIRGQEGEIKVKIGEKKSAWSILIKLSTNY